MKTSLFKKAASASLSILILLSSGICAFSEASPSLPEFGTKITDGFEEIYLNPDGTTYTRHLDDSINASSAQDEELFSDGDITFYSSSEEKLKSVTLPSSFDLRDVDGESYVTRPECQYNGDCWTYATMSTLESNALMQGYSDPHFSKSHLGYFAYNPLNEGETSDDPLNVGGNMSVAASVLMNLEGIANKSDYPNAISSTPSYSELDRYNHGSGFLFDEAVELKTTAEVKEWLMENGAVYTSYYMTNTHYPDSVDLPVQYNQVESTNHAITIVGWDDTIPASTFSFQDYALNDEGTYELTDICPSSDGAWIVKNSVGLSYNNELQEYYDDNYMYIPYEQYFGSFSGLKVKEDTDIYNNYTYTERNTNIYFNMATAAYANVFTAEGNEAITEIGFDLDTENQLTSVTATFKIYRNLPSSYTTPEAGTLAATFTETYTNDGYYTFNLPEEVDISAGEIYSVIISCVDSGGCYIQVPCERTGGDYVYTGAAKQSYYKSGSRYYDLVSTYSSSSVYNVFMHVYTKCSHTEAEKTDGTQLVTYCSQCGKELSRSCITHTWGDSVTEEEPTCTSTGVAIRTCTLCGEEETVAIPATGHTYGDATYSSIREGTNIKDYYKVCTVCGSRLITHSDIKTTNTMTLAELLRMIFERIFAAFL